MRVLIVVHGFPPQQSGGAERRAARTARGLLARGHMVRVLAADSLIDPQAVAYAEDMDHEGTPVRRLYLNRSTGAAGFRRAYDNPQVATFFTQLLDEWRPDVVHLFSGYLMSASVVRAAYEHGVPVVVSLTDYWWLCHRINLVRTDGTRCDGPTDAGCARCQAESQRRYRLPARAIPVGADLLWRAAASLPALGARLGLPEQAERRQTLCDILGHAAALIAPSHYLAELYARHGVDPARLRVWRQGVELDACPLRSSDPALRVGYIGQMKHHKGVHLLLEAWGRLQGSRPRRLSLYGSDEGEGHYGRQLREQIAGLEHVEWRGSFRGAEVWQVLAGLDVLIVPSRWVENSPNSILEAQAVGVPIVGSDLGGIAELVQHERNGLLFRVDDPADLARQLQRLLDQPDLVGRLQQAALPFRTIDDEIDQIDGLYHEVMSSLPQSQTPALLLT
jgi:glycosyltransferase involved in cell wall biosynthesis